MKLLRLSLATVGIALIVAPIFPQAAAGGRPSFEVASIRPSKPGTRTEIVAQPGGRFVANGVPLRLLIAIAYHLQGFQMSGEKGWITNELWSIEAEATSGNTLPSSAGQASATPPYMGVPKTMAIRLQSLLEDRFGLKAHWETRDLPVYALTVGSGGSKLEAAAPPPRQKPERSAAQSKGNRRLSQGDASLAPPPGSVLAGPGEIIASAVTMDQILTLLNRLMDRPVIDKTGLHGYYNLKLQFDPAIVPRMAFGAAHATGSPLLPPRTGDPSIFTAIQEQLGLKLRFTREPVKTFVIDSAHRPAEN